MAFRGGRVSRDGKALRVGREMLGSRESMAFRGGRASRDGKALRVGREMLGSRESMAFRGGRASRDGRERVFRDQAGPLGR